MKALKRPLLWTALFSSSIFFVGCGSENDDPQPAVETTISMQELGIYESGVFDKSAAEIVAYDKVTQQTFVVNANSGKVDILDASDPSNPAKSSEIILATDLGVNAGAANSVSFYNGLLAVAVESTTKTDNGWIAFYSVTDSAVTFLEAVEVGALPDMVTFTPNGNQVVAAIEGEPNEDYSIDPEGQVAVIDIVWDGNTLSNTSLTTIGFTDFNEGGSRYAELPIDKMVLDGLNATTAQSFEPEYVAVNADSSKAYVSLQENNAIAVVDLVSKTVDKIIGLGFKDHSVAGNEFDASQKDGVNIQNWPVKGIYMPDTIATMEYNGTTYILTANEGDDRQDWLENVTDRTACETSGYYFDASDNCIDAFSAKDYYDNDNVTLNSGLATNGGFGEDDELYRLKFSYHTTVAMNGGTNFDTLYAYGGRSFSIYNAETGEQVFDSGSDFEVKTAEIYGENFNNDNAENTGDDRSDNKGPEPEALTVGKVGDKTYAFIGLERMGGVMVYDVTNPEDSTFVEYLNNRNVDIGFDETNFAQAGDLGPEGMKFVSAEDSPNGQPLLIVANEVSGTTTFYQISEQPISE